MTDYDNHVPIKNVTFESNVYTTHRPATQPHTDIHNLSKITNLVADFGALSWPGTHRDVTTLNSENLPNGDFAAGGLAYWSHEGDVSVHGGWSLAGIADANVREIAERLCTAPAAWGWLHT